MEKTCFFIGHQDAPDSLAPELDALVERHITEYGVGEFVVGRYGGFDALAASAVKRAKARRPDVRLVCLRPYHPAERPEKTPSGFDGSFLSSGDGASSEKAGYRPGQPLHGGQFRCPHRRL